MSLDSKRKSRLKKEVQIETTTEVTRSEWVGHFTNLKADKRFSDEVRGYLQKNFDTGKKTGRKEDPAQVANDMQNARNTDDARMFSKMEWLSKLQIQGFFSRVSTKRKQSDGKETSSDDDEPDNNEELAVEYASLTDEQMFEKASVAVQSEIGVKHLVMYDVYNLCEMAFENRL